MSTAKAGVRGVKVVMVIMGLAALFVGSAAVSAVLKFCSERPPRVVEVAPAPESRVPAVAVAAAGERDAGGTGGAVSDGTDAGVGEVAPGAHSGSAKAQEDPAETRRKLIKAVRIAHKDEHFDQVRHLKPTWKIPRECVRMIQCHAQMMDYFDAVRLVALALDDLELARTYSDRADNLQTLMQSIALDLDRIKRRGDRDDMCSRVAKALYEEQDRIAFAFTQACQ